MLITPPVRDTMGTKMFFKQLNLYFLSIYLSIIDIYKCCFKSNSRTRMHTLNSWWNYWIVKLSRPSDFWRSGCSYGRYHSSRTCSRFVLNRLEDVRIKQIQASSISMAPYIHACMHVCIHTLITYSKFKQPSYFQNWYASIDHIEQPSYFWNLYSHRYPKFSSHLVSIIFIAL